VIPLAKKLAECGVFGVSSSEHLSYAERNRKEWADRGHDVVAEILFQAKEKYGRHAMKPFTRDIRRTGREMSRRNLLKAGMDMEEEEIDTKATDQSTPTSENHVKDSDMDDEKTQGNSVTPHIVPERIEI